ncbi:DNA topoisomerase, partial [Methylobacterium sp. E-065]|uniref:DNA topoisomerase n=1 Tax=Methylobacterium sp. E-065 TaxID=2836583 RepID=UPI00391A4A37|nr:DNA topoisomerase [Methylobacterium sp. E-065]
TATTEPPRRITRGELPVVMGRLIDQVDDPAVKRALENPVNPNEPKGLGTAATRDTILPKLLKSRYITLSSGKDPAIEMTEVGLAFITAVRRVFPAYGDPVGRALFEAELAEIGRAATRAEAIERADAFRQRTCARLDELIAAISNSTVVSLDPSLIPPDQADDRPPTPAMVSFAVSLAERKGVKLPRGCKSSISVCRSFLDIHAGPRAPQLEDGAGRPQGRRIPSAAMLSYARSLAEQRSIPCPPEVETDFDACRRFLDAHGSRPQRGSETPSSGSTKAKGPAGRGKRRGRGAQAPRQVAAPRRA